MKLTLFPTSKKGFTLLEMLMVVTLISVLAGIVILAINPGKQLGDARNAQRSADVNTIMNAVYQYVIDNNGKLPGNISTTSEEICVTGASCEGLVDLSDLTTDETYLVSIPTDPMSASENGAGYKVSKSKNGRVTVSAPDAEGSVNISITR